MSFPDHRSARSPEPATAAVVPPAIAVAFNFWVQCRGVLRPTVVVTPQGDVHTITQAPLSEAERSAQESAAALLDLYFTDRALSDDFNSPGSLAEDARDASAQA